jgi:peptidoglycan/LPS O-acetylase OafA/YrhL
LNTNTSRGQHLRTWIAGNLDGLVLLAILLAVGGFAGAASFTHVHDWTMDNSPDNTGDWFGWANAVISELVPVASLLVIRRRRRRGQSIVYPAFLLVVALTLSITAQLAVAKPGFWGGLVSVIPALAFAALAKLIIGKPAKDNEASAEPVPTQETVWGELVPAQPVPSPNGQRDTAGLIGTVTR